MKKIISINFLLFFIAGTEGFNFKNYKFFSKASINQRSLGIYQWFINLMQKSSIDAVCEISPLEFVFATDGKLFVKNIFNLGSLDKTQLENFYSCKNGFKKKFCCERNLVFNKNLSANAPPIISFAHAQIFAITWSSGKQALICMVKIEGKYCIWTLVPKNGYITVKNVKISCISIQHNDFIVKNMKCFGDILYIHGEYPQYGHIHQVLYSVFLNNQFGSDESLERVFAAPKKPKTKAYYGKLFTLLCWTVKNDGTLILVIKNTANVIVMKYVKNSKQKIGSIDIKNIPGPVAAAIDDEGEHLLFLIDPHVPPLVITLGDIKSDSIKNFCIKNKMEIAKTFSGRLIKTFGCFFRKATKMYGSCVVYGNGSVYSYDFTKKVSFSIKNCRKIILNDYAFYEEQLFCKQVWFESLYENALIKESYIIDDMNKQCSKIVYIKIVYILGRAIIHAILSYSMVRLIMTVVKNRVKLPVTEVVLRIKSTGILTVYWLLMNQVGGINIKSDPNYAIILYTFCIYFPTHFFFKKMPLENV